MPPAHRSRAADPLPMYPGRTRASMGLTDVQAPISMLIQDASKSPKADSAPPADLGRQAQGRGREARRAPRRRPARAPSAVVSASSCARHAASLAARLEPAQPALVPRHRAHVRVEQGAGRFSPRPLFRAGQSRASHRRGARFGPALERHAGAGHLDREAVERGDGAAREGLRRSLSRARAQDASRGGAGHRVRPRELHRSLAQARREGWSGRCDRGCGPLQFGGCKRPDGGASHMAASRGVAPSSSRSGAAACAWHLMPRNWRSGGSSESRARPSRDRRLLHRPWRPLQRSGCQSDLLLPISQRNASSRRSGGLLLTGVSSALRRCGCPYIRFCRYARLRDIDHPRSPRRGRCVPGAL